MGTKEINKKTIDFLEEPERMASMSMKDIYGGMKMTKATGCSTADHITSVIGVSKLEVW